MIAVLGMGYVGLPLALSFAGAGKKIIGFDINPKRIDSLRRGSSPVETITSTDLLTQADNITFTSEPTFFQDCNVFVICVPTPLTKESEPDVSAIVAAADLIAPYLKVGDLVILESTSYPGTTEDLLGERLFFLSGLKPGFDFRLSFSPERVDPGNTTFGIKNTPKIVSGLTPECRDSAADLYGEICSEIVLAGGTREAELSKLIENTYRQVNIALMNDLAKASRALGIDIYEAIRCAATKPFGFQEFQPGPGVGGHCIPVDPMFLHSEVKKRTNIDLQQISLAQKTNASMPEYVTQRVEQELNQRGELLEQSRILLLGVGYKSGTKDTRESPAERLAEILQTRGASICFADPNVTRFIVHGEEIEPIALESLSETISSFDVTVLMNVEQEFLEINVVPEDGFCMDTQGAHNVDNYPPGSIIRL